MGVYGVSIARGHRMDDGVARLGEDHATRSVIGGCGGLAQLARFSSCCQGREGSSREAWTSRDMDAAGPAPSTVTGQGVKATREQACDWRAPAWPSLVGSIIEILPD